MVLEQLEPTVVWEIFENLLSQTPRESKKEDKVRKAIKKWVKEKSETKNLEISIYEDDVGNILIQKPATDDMQHAPPLLLQGHMDIVAETDRPDGFDFDTEPIPVRIQENGEWVDAEGTTLGADNGIGVALALALLIEEDLSHGPIEVLLTVDEETGLTGAFGLDVDKLPIASKLMINIDTEDMYHITIGAAGGGNTKLTRKLDLEETDKKGQYMELKVSGLLGGHSGVDIHQPRANANKLVARMLSAVAEEIPVRLSRWNGGSKHNAIARDSVVLFAVNADDKDKASFVLEEEKKQLLSYYHEEDEPLEPNISISWDETDSEPLSNVEESKGIIETANAIPHGPIRFSPAIEGLVELSNNFAIISTDERELLFHLSSRSNIDSELDALRRRLADLGRLGEWEVELQQAYPGWTPKPKSPFLKFVKKQYAETTGEEIVIEAVHAGLECGLIGAKIPGMQTVSIGPTIENPHTPDERVRIEDVAKIYELLQTIVTKLPETGQ
ncbi:MAG: beta-Ala-His dipeptidase [Promethearchaeati archaeon]